MKQRLTLLVLIPLILLSACGTLFVAGGADFRAGDRAFREGKYDVAAEKALAALETNPEFPEAAELLQKAAVQGPQNLLAEIDTLKSSGQAFVHDSIWREYAHLERIHKILSASTFSSTYPTKSYAEERNAAKEAAAEEYYQAGSRELAKGDFRSARQAVTYFSSARALISDYRDTADRLAQANQAGIARVMVYSVQGRDTLEKAVTDELRTNSTIREYTQFVSSAAMGIGQGRSLANVVRDSQNAGVDMLLYIESQATGRGWDTSRQPNNSIAGGQLSGWDYTWGYNQEIEGSFQLIDVPQGQILAQHSFSDSNTESIEATIITGSSNMSLNLREFGQGNFAVLTVHEITPLYYGVYSDFFTAARDFSNKENYQTVVNVDSFDELKQLIHNEVWFYGTEILKDASTEMYYPLYDKDRSVNNNRYQFSKVLFDSTNSKAKILAGQRAQDYSTLEQSAGSAIGDSIKKYIQ